MTKDMSSLPTWRPTEERSRAGSGRYAASNFNRAVYYNNCKIFKAGGYQTESGKEVTLPEAAALARATVVYDSAIPLSSNTHILDDTVTGVANRDSMLVAKSLQQRGLNPAVLNLASRYHACGAYDRGSRAQEESLCRESTLSQSLYPFFDEKLALASAAPFIKKAYPLDERFGGIYSSGVTVFRDIEHGYALLDTPFTVGVVTVAALNFHETTRYANLDLKYRTPDNGFTDEGRELMKDKIRTIYRIALAGGHDSLVPGAFGCGVFNLRPELVAALFRDVLDESEFKNRFLEVCFAILEPFGPYARGREGKFRAFYELFGE